MTSYEVYESLLEARRTNNKGRLEHAARCWSEMSLPNPFEMGTEACEQYFQMTQKYGIWKRGAINMKKSRLLMIEAAEKLADLNLPNPYQVTIDEVMNQAADAPLVNAASPEEAAQAVEKLDEPEMVFGVIPEKKKHFGLFGREEE